MRLRCPVCHAEAALEAWAEDEAARSLMALLAGMDAELGRPLVAYLGLFRSGTRALSWERALRIAGEVMALGADQTTLAAALSQTVEQLRAKRDAGDARPLSSHGYLKRVIEGMRAAGAAVPQAVAEVELMPRRDGRGARLAQPSATMDGLMQLEALKRRALAADGGSEVV